MTDGGRVVDPEGTTFAEVRASMCSRAWEMQERNFRRGWASGYNAGVGDALRLVRLYELKLEEVVRVLDEFLEGRVREWQRAACDQYAQPPSLEYGRGLWDQIEE